MKSSTAATPTRIASFASAIESSPSVGFTKRLESILSGAGIAPALRTFLSIVAST